MSSLFNERFVRPLNQLETIADRMAELLRDPTQLSPERLETIRHVLAEYNEWAKERDRKLAQPS